MMNSKESEEFESSARAIAEEISAFRREWIDSAAGDILDEMEDLEKEGFDPARGRGRGPSWMNGEQHE